LTVDVAEEDGRHRAAVPFEDRELPCCAPGHADPVEAARHAGRLTRAIARKMIPAEA
jgi:hypothetical protein